MNNELAHRQASTAHPPVRIRLLGRFELTTGNRPLRVTPAGERLLAYLAIRPDPVGRYAVASALWPDCTDVRAAANLRSTLWRLPGHNQAEVVTSSAGRIALMPAVSVDIHDVGDQLIRRSATEASVATLRQDVLPDWPEDWLTATREWFRQVRLHALEALSDQHRAAGRLDAALDAGLAAVTCDPLRESAHRRLVRLHIAEGNFSEALRQYDIYRRLVQAELGLPPSPQFRRLMAPLLGRPLDQHG